MSDPITLARLLALPDWAHAVRVLAGDGRLAATVGVVQCRNDLGQDELIAADALVIVVGPTEMTDWRVDALIRRAADARAAGVLLSTGEAPPSLTTRLLCDRLRMSLLGGTGNLLDLAVTARLHLVQPRVDRAEVVLALHRALEHRPHSPEEIVTTLRSVLDAEVAVLDHEGTVLAGELTGPIRIRPGEPVPQSSAESDRTTFAHPVALQPGRPAMWLSARIGDARADVVADALTVAASALQRWLSVQRLDLERGARSRAALLADLRRVDGEPSIDLRRRAADIGWRLDGWHIGMRFGLRSTMDTTGRAGELRDLLRSQGLDVALVEQGDGWTAWMTLDTEPTAGEIRRRSAQMRAAHRLVRTSLPVHTGIGRPHPRTAGLAATLAEAFDAARLAATRAESGYFLHVDQLGMAQLLLEWTRTDTFEPAARALLAPLHTAAGDLIPTLAAYLDAESTIAETAAVLGVHRNTISARIQRIGQLLGVDLTDRDARLALHLACRTVLLASQDR